MKSSVEEYSNIQNEIMEILTFFLQIFMIFDGLTDSSKKSSVLRTMEFHFKQAAQIVVPRTKRETLLFYVFIIDTYINDFKNENEN